MLSKNKISDLRALQQKKYREESQTFLIETPKILDMFLQSNAEIIAIYCTEDFRPSTELSVPVYRVCAHLLAQISTLKTPQSVVALVKMPPLIPLPILDKGVFFVLDHIQDPGNLGAILRICDWFGIERLICSRDTVDLYNPKTLQASMGSAAHVKVHYIEDLSTWRLQQPGVFFAAMLTGAPYYTIPHETDQAQFLLMGNEANGLSTVLAEKARAITIPRIGRAESLNVAVAAGILAAHFYH